jgi:hypothetical protein
MSFASRGLLYRVVACTLKTAALIVVMAVLTGWGPRVTDPPTAVLGEVEVLGLEVVAADTGGVIGTDPSVQILDALCVTSEATPELC